MLKVFYLAGNWNKTVIILTGGNQNVKSIFQNCDCAIPVSGYVFQMPILVVPYLNGWPKQGSQEFVFLHIYVRIFFYLANSSGLRYRTIPDDA